MALIGMLAPGVSARATDLPFGQVKNGSIAVSSQENKYTFTDNAGDVVDFTMTTTSGNLNPKMRLYNPDGSLNRSASNYYASGACYPSATVAMNSVTLPATGTYTVLVGDCADTNTGSYDLYAQSTFNAAGGTNLARDVVAGGSIASAAQSTTFTFTGTANDVLDFTVATAGFDPRIRLYNPDGTLNTAASNYYASGACYLSPIVEMNTITLPASGTYTVLIADCGDTSTGAFNLYMQSTRNPAGAANVLWGEVQSGNVGSSAQSKTYKFTGATNDVVSFTLSTVGFNPKIRLYNPDGTLNHLASNYYASGACFPSSTVEMNTITLSAAGTYTVLIGDCGDHATGTYNVSTQCNGVCQLAAPVISSLSPTSALVGSAGFKLIVQGSNFVSVNAQSVVQWNGADLNTTFVKTGQLTAAVPSADLAVAGCVPVTVYTPSSGSGSIANTSNSVQFCVNNPTPILTSITPVAATAGGPGFTLTLNGSGFVPTSAALWNGNALATTYVSASQLTASVPAADIATGGAASITVSNPSPGGGVTAPQVLTIQNPVPSISGIAPTPVLAGRAPLTLTVSGSGFVTTSNVQMNGVGKPTTYVSSTHLTALISSSDLACGSIDTITVMNATPGGGTTASKTLTVNNPLPATTSILPASAAPGAAPLTLTVAGSNFVTCSVVQWNGAGLATTYVSAHKLTAVVPASALQAPGTANITVASPAPSGGTSSPALPFTIGSYPLPATSSIQPTSATAGTSGFTLTVNGSNFVQVSTVDWNNTALPTTFVSSNKLTAVVPQANIATAGTANVTVVNPSPGGGTSSPKVFTVNNPVPSISSMTPTSVPAQSPQFTLCVTGTNLVPGSVIMWNGASLVTTLVNSTEVCATIPASVIAAPGTATVTVSNPTPGGGIASPSLTFTISNAQAATPAISPGGGSYGTGQLISITDATPGAVLYYTMDGTAPTTGSAKYSKPLIISSSVTVQAIAVAPGFTESAAASAAYIIGGSAVVLDLPAIALTSSSGTMQAQVNGEGLAGQVWFAYGTSSTALSSTTTVQSLIASNKAQKIQAALTGLSANTTYYYQAVVTTPGGTSSGAIVSFKTP